MFLFVKIISTQTADNAENLTVLTWRSDKKITRINLNGKEKPKL